MRIVPGSTVPVRRARLAGGLRARVVVSLIVFNAGVAGPGCGSDSRRNVRPRMRRVRWEGQGMRIGVWKENARGLDGCGEGWRWCLVCGAVLLVVAGQICLVRVHTT